MFKKALRYGLFLEYKNKKICLACEYELLDNQGIKYRGYMGRKQGVARIKEIAKKQDINPARYSYMRLLSSLCYVFGGLFLLVAVYVYLYYQTNWINHFGLAFTPYQNYAIPLMIGGIALLTLIFVIEQRVIVERKGGWESSNL